MNDLDKTLDDILLRHGAEQGELHHSLKEEIKQLIQSEASRRVISELEHITADGDDAAVAIYWFNDADGHYHEIDIPTRIAELFATQAKEEE